MPLAILICDVEHWDFYDLERGGEQISFTLAELPQFICLFDYLAGYERRVPGEDEPVNIRAAELMGELHDQLKGSGYTGHALELYLVRLLFCLFADDTGIFERDSFQDCLRGCAAEVGQGPAQLLAEVFRVLNTPEEQRDRTRNAQLLSLPYVNGGLFAEHLPLPAADAGLRDILLECCKLDWGKISPAVFGSMLRSVLKPGARRSPGAHFSAERHILKLISPLFLDSLYEEFEEICAERSTRRCPRLQEFHRKLARLRFLDPACGSGNFLVLAYRELRLLELAVIRELESAGLPCPDIAELCRVSAEQFCGIEIEEFPALLQ